MIKHRKKVIAVAAVAASVFGMTAGAQSASADPSAGSKDVVGVGSDTLQYLLDFAADGKGTTAGYNPNRLGRIFSYDASADANGRLAYLNNSSNTQNPTLVLRAGQTPIRRPNGSGDGLKALINQTTGASIDFSRSSSVPLGADEVNEEANYGASDPLHVVRIANEHLALDASTDPAHLSVLLDPTQWPDNQAHSLSLYQVTQIATGAITTWSQLGANGSHAGDTINLILGQTGSGTRKTSLQDLGWVNGTGATSANTVTGTTVALSTASNIKTSEENDPYGLFLPFGSTSGTADIDAIGIQSSARIALYNSGYFHDPTAAPAEAGTFNPAVLSPGIGMVPVTNPVAPAGNDTTPNTDTVMGSGASPSDAAAYDDNRGLYIVFRKDSETSQTKFNGGTANAIQTLFWTGTSVEPQFEKAATQTLLKLAGATPDYADCGYLTTTTTITSLTGQCVTYTGPGGTAVSAPIGSGVDHV